MNPIIPEWPGLPDNVAAMTTTRHGGVSRAPYDDGNGAGGLNLGVHVGDLEHDVLQNRARLRDLLPAEPAWLSQVHGVTVLDAAEVKNTPEADASIAVEPGVVCVIQTADCLPVLFCDTQGKVVGAAHAGWRGLLHGVLENTVTQMRAAGAGEITAWFGPAIGQQRFEVGKEVMQAFVGRDGAALAAFQQLPHQPGKYLADIYQLARRALNRVNVTRVHGGDFCTVTEAQRFYSYRRDKVTGRIASLIWLK